MIKGTIDGIFIKIVWEDQSCKVTTPNNDIKRLLEYLSGEVYNPITNELYYANLVDSEINGYLLISDLVNYNFEVKLSEYPNIESEEDVIY